MKNSKTSKKLILSRITVRSLTGISGQQLAKAVGGWSGVHFCHSMDDFQCPEPSGGGYTCDATMAADCGSL